MAHIQFIRRDRWTFGLNNSNVGRTVLINNLHQHSSPLFRHHRIQDRVQRRLQRIQRVGEKLESQHHTVITEVCDIHDNGEKSWGKCERDEHGEHHENILHQVSEDKIRWFLFWKNKNSLIMHDLINYSWPKIWEVSQHWVKNRKTSRHWVKTDETYSETRQFLNFLCKNDTFRDSFWPS